MEFLRRSWQQIRLQVEQWPPNLKWMVGLSLIVLVGPLLIVLQYAGRPDYVSIRGFATQRPEMIEARLQDAGIDVRRGDAGLKVEKGRYLDALKVLMQSGMMAPDTSEAWGALFEGPSVFESNYHFNKRIHWAKQKALSVLIGSLAGVESAEVLMDVPTRTSLGREHVLPSASVNVIVEQGKELDDECVEAIARLVSGAVAEMKPANVSVIDAVNGVFRTVADRSRLNRGKLHELNQVLVREKEQQILKAMGIPGLRVAVTVITDQIQSQRVQETGYAAQEPLASSRDESSEKRSQESGGETAVRPNTSLGIDGASGAGTQESTEQSEQTYLPPPVTTMVDTVPLTNSVVKINASVQVPHSYLSMVISPAADGADGAAAGRLAHDDPRVVAELERIKTQIEPIVETQKVTKGDGAESPGIVAVSMLYDDPMRQAGMARAGPRGVALMFGDDWVRTAGLGLLVLTALGLMLSMVRKATREPSLPSAEELAGVPPPPVSTDDDVVGEAEESDVSLTGVEVAEQDLRARHVAEQISELVRANPEEAAHLLNKWLMTEE